ncbi:SDR family oxidoreductase [Virgibacillus sp. NKC19-3]|uniref:SDR family NAD(P)-dependent oxidoreductase n=1 Tax=Virgibacillus saliphilus TaxID=2831674 RepID=UPI001C9B2192|nr:SDR family oxidoreductase [Virgibacillus sp. NKC19-3]MBY7144670.1 SDR family oxidoreductase [Virgibacillus sp. NKC19-3]
MFDLTGNIALVTGGANGIGQGIVKTLAKAGANVMICDIDEAAGEATAKEVGGEFHKLDVTDKHNAEQVVQDIVAKHDSIDILAANAGIFPEVLIEDMEEEDWETIQSINLKGIFFIVKPVLNVMKKQNYGRVILTSSITGDITGYPGGSIYGATKAGILGFMRSAALEYAKYGVTVNSIQPGMIATEGLKEQLGVLSEKGAEAVPMKRLGEPEDIGVTVCFFASEEAKYVTGQSLVVDGGQIMPETPDVIS